MIRIKGHLHTGPGGLGAINCFVMDLCQVVNDLEAGYMIGAPTYSRYLDGYQAEWTLFVPDEKADKATSSIEAIRPASFKSFVNRTKKFAYGHDTAL